MGIVFLRVTLFRIPITFGFAAAGLCVKTGGAFAVEYGRYRAAHEVGVCVGGKGIVYFLAVAAGGYYFSLLQHAEMVRYRGERHAEGVRDFADAFFRNAEKNQHAQSCAVTYQLEQFRYLFRRLFVGHERQTALT